MASAILSGNTFFVLSVGDKLIDVFTRTFRGYMSFCIVIGALSLAA